MKDSFKLFEIRECQAEIELLYDSYGDEPDMPPNIIARLDRVREKLSRLDPRGEQA